MKSPSLPRGLGLLTLLAALLLAFTHWAQYELKPILSRQLWLPLELLFHLSGVIIAVTSFLAALGYGLLLGLLISKLLWSARQTKHVSRLMQLPPKGLQGLVVPSLAVVVFIWFCFFWSPYVYGPITAVRLLFIAFGLVVFEFFALHYFETRGFPFFGERR